MPTLTVYFDTGTYRRSHGHEPRGHGMWAFDGIKDSAGELRWFKGTYAEAKKGVKQHLKQKGLTGVYCVTVLP